MSEPIPSNRTNVAPYRIELPPNLVTAQMVPHHMAGEDGSLVRTGKIEVRIVNPITRKDAKRSVDWHATAMNCAHQTAYYKQVYDNQAARIEELERKYSEAAYKYEDSKRWKSTYFPLIREALDLVTWWGWFMLPKTFKRYAVSEE